jgi:hypothetical protein
MATTRYVTGDSNGVVTLVARAIDPDGNIINEQFTITVNPLPQAPRCYTSILALSTTQDSVESACSQFGVANTYYLGNPRNTVYSTDSCSNIAPDGFYKTEDNNWVNISGGVIRQRGACNTVAVAGPRRVDTGGISNDAAQVRAALESGRVGIPVPVRSVTDQVLERFVQEQPFTPPSPTTSPPQPTFTREQNAERVQQRVQQIIPQIPEQQPILTQTQTFVDLNAIQSQITTALGNIQPSFRQATRQAPPIATIFGCTDPSAINYNPNATNDDGSCQFQAVDGSDTFF